MGKVNIPYDGEYVLYYLFPSDPEALSEYGQIAFVAQNEIAHTPSDEPLMAEFVREVLSDEDIDSDNIKSATLKREAIELLEEANESFKQIQNTRLLTIHTLNRKEKSVLLEQLLNLAKAIWKEVLDVLEKENAI